MRLDHLLSRERTEGESRKFGTEVDMRSGSESGSGSVGHAGETAEGRHPEENRRRDEVVPESRIVLKIPERIFESMWGFSSAGRAPALQAGGHRFEPDNLHHEGR